MRLIDADKLKEHKFLTPDAEEAKKWLPAETQGYQLGWNDAIDAIVDNAPTVDNNEYNRGFMHAMTMVGKEAEERPHGEWIYHEEWENEGGCGYECSCCGRTYDYGMNFCGYCGADMRVKDELKKVTDNDG